MTFDYIIVGQGLAGSAVALQLLEKNKKILVIDQPEKNHSSRIAAGLFNPITGRNLVKTWLADEIFPYLHEFYSAAEKKTGMRFFYPMPLYRPFLSVEEQNEWMAKSAEPSYLNYIDKTYTQHTIAQVKDPFGGLLLKRCGYLDTNTYLPAVRNLIHQTALFVEEPFQEDQLTILDDEVSYKDYNARKIIFCHGVHVNKWFGWLPLRLLKGETLQIQTTSFAEKLILNRGVYFVPAAPQHWKVGATYNFDDKTPGTTPGARQELEGKIKEVASFPYQVISQEWGLRPTTPDHRPILGTHPTLKPVIIFNGLGTKGVSLAPYFSEVLVRSLENNEPINKVVNIERYKSVYSNSPI